MKVALDTNILAYAEGTNGSEMKERAIDLIQRLTPEMVVIPAQALGELFTVLVRKAKRLPIDARTAILGWRDAYASSDTSATVVLKAVDSRRPPQPIDLGFGDSVSGSGSRLPSPPVTGPPRRLHVAGRDGRKPLRSDHASAAPHLD